MTDSDETAFQRISGVFDELVDIRGISWRAEGQSELVDSPALEPWDEVREIVEKRVEENENERYIHSNRIHYYSDREYPTRPYLQAKLLSGSTPYWIQYCEEGYLYLFGSPPDAQDFRICRFNISRDTSFTST